MTKIRSDIKTFQEMPNVGKSIEKQFFLLGLKSPSELAGKDPYQMYADLCHLKNSRLDPCVLDIFISAVRYIEGGPPKKWWEFTEQRKKRMGTG